MDIDSKAEKKPGEAFARRVVVAGAGGLLGRLIVRELMERGDRVVAVVRRPVSAAEFTRVGVESRVLDGLKRGAWSGVCDGADVVVSSLGASVNPSPLVGWRPYTAVDAPANIELLSEARRAGVRRFVYVSLIDGAAGRALDYAEGHERVVDALRLGDVPATVLRPTGFFAAMGELLRLARRGVVPVFGDGLCRTNPIHEADLALAAVDATNDTSPGLREVELGGPEEFARRDIARMAFEALGKPPCLLHVSPAFARAAAHTLRLVNPRAGHFTLFAVYVMTHACVAPRVGTRRIGDYFRELALTLK